ncbi:MAG TPA: 2-hydroxyacid dehydrogenase [Spirochaetales bacterium]|nr:2-hydroxyacid dehydrogenase [Spirochaetales bacterium]
MRIGFIYPYNRLWEQYTTPLIEKYSEHEFVTDRNKALKEIESFDVLVGGIEPKGVYEQAHSVKAVFVPFVGVDHLPAPLFLEKGVRVFNSHGNARFVAERALALLLCCTGKVLQYHQDLTRGIWHGWAGRKGVSDGWDSIVGYTATLLGTGAIAQWIARYLKVFDCRIVGYKKRPVSQLPEGFDEVVYDLPEALKRSDIVISTLPLTEETRGLIGRNEFALMKGKVLVNVGRGEVIQEEALYTALKDGVLKSAGIDTWYSYPKEGETAHAPSRFPFQELPNVVLSPHIAGFTEKATEENIRVTVANLDAYLSGKSVPNEVDLRLSY